MDRSRTLRAALLAALLTPVAAAEVRLDSSVDPGFVGDEPNVRSHGTLPYSWSETSALYPPDRNGLELARAGEPTPVLAVEWVHRACAYGAACAEAAASPLLASFLERNHLVPGLGHFQAWHGVFADLDGDGRIRDGNRAGQRVHVGLDGGCGGVADAGVFRTDDPYGLGGGQGMPSGLSLRCGRSTEWHPLVAPIVAYVTPGSWRNSDVPNRAAEAWNPLVAPRTAQETPDLTFAERTVAGERTGRYHAPESNFDMLVPDGSLLTTLLVEAMSRPTTSVTGDRTHEPGTDSLVDVDLYQSLDPALEGALATSVGSALVRSGCDARRPEHGCRATTDPYTEPVRVAKDRAFAPAGPVVAAFFPASERDPQERDRSEAGLYLDLYLETSASLSLVRAEFRSGDRLGTVLPFSNSGMSPSGTGRVHATPQVTVLARLGVWHDLDGDGWIGSAVPAPGCPDAHDCGSRPNPHRYEDARGEYVPLCGVHETAPLAPSAHGAFHVEVTPVQGHWGAAGVYVLTDRRAAGDPERDNLRDDGRGAYDPYDDVLVHGADSLVFTGPVRLTLTCSASRPGFYTSYERLVFPLGSNYETDLLVAGGTEARYVRSGLTESDRAADEDLVRAW